MAFISCPECGTQCSDQAVNCTNCGFGFSSLKKCGECGAVLDPNKAFCPQCGCPINQAQPSSLQPVPQPPQQQYPQQPIQQPYPQQPYPQQQYQPQPLQQPYQQPATLSNVPASDSTGARIIALLVGVLLAAMPFLSFYSFAKEISISVVGLVTELSKIDNLLRSLPFGFSTNLREIAGLEITQSVTYAAFICVPLLMGGYTNLIMALTDVTVHTEHKAIRFWKRLSIAVLLFLIFTAVIGFTFLTLSFRIGDGTRLNPITVNVPHYIVQVVGLAVFIYARVNVKKLSVSLRKKISWL